MVLLIASVFFFPGWFLCFSCDPSLQSHTVRLFCDYEHDGTEFTELKWKPNEYVSSGYDVVSDAIHIEKAGSFRFYYTTNGR